MSDSNPNPEERKRIVDAAMLSLKRNNPALFAPDPSDLERFFAQLNAAIEHVRRTNDALIRQSITFSTIHTAKGRRDMENHLTKAFLDAFTPLNRDELLFALAFTHAKVLLAEYV